MDFSFFQKEMKEILKEDSGFQEFLATLSESERDSLTDIISDGTILNKLVNFLPDSLKGEINKTLQDIVEIPRKALGLYEECRFGEARDLLNQTISLYSYDQKTSVPELDRAREFVSTRLKALCYNLLGEVEWSLGKADEAAHCHRTSIKLAERVRDNDTCAKALLGLATQCWRRGSFEEALDYCHNALEHLEGNRDRWNSRSKILTTLSVILCDMGQSDDAVDHAARAVDLCYEIDDKKSLPVSLSNLACLFMEEGDPAHAMEALEEAIVAARETRDLREEALICNNLAMCLLRGSKTENEMDMAREELTHALSISKDISSPSLEAMATGNMGFVQQLRAKQMRREHLSLKRPRFTITLGRKRMRWKYTATWHCISKSSWVISTVPSRLARRPSS